MPDRRSSTRREVDNTDHDLLIRLDEKLTEVLRRMDTQDSRIATIETKVSTLEGFRWWVMGIAAAVSAVFSYLVTTVKR